MATVELTITALPVHVRTARLIVTAVARRSGIAEALLDEVRLAVGEACARAVEAHRQHCPAEPVRLEMTDDKGRFEVTVSDSVAGDDAAGDGIEPASIYDLAGDDGTALLGLAVIAGLADEVAVTSTPKGVEIRMSWPV